MSTRAHYDYIIAGAGAAGLSLLHSILSSPTLKTKQILLVDQYLSPATDKTWSFWANQDEPVTKMATLRWKKVNVSAFNETFSTHLKGLNYYCIKSEAYTSALLTLAKDSPNVTRVKASIQQLIHLDNGVKVKTDAGVFTGEWCFQSVIQKKIIKKESQKEIKLLQHFMGWEIEVNSPLFKENEVTLMDFDTPQGDGVTFFYVLPFSETFALIEYTMFSEKMCSDLEYEAEIREYLKQKYQLDENDYTIRRKEIGAIPMESVRLAGTLNPRTLNIGMVGGHTKPSTGYTFMRIQRQVHSIVKRLEKGLKPVHEGGSSFRFRVYDIMLLSILEKDPSMGVKIFHDLFKKNSMELIFKFLDEKTHILEELKIFSTLPYLPFLASIYRMRVRILSGA